MWNSNQNKRLVLKAVFKLFDKRGIENITIEQVRKAAQKIHPKFPITRERFDGYRGAYASRNKHKKSKHLRKKS